MSPLLAILASQALAATSGLTQSSARSRAARVSDVAYALVLDVGSSTAEFRGYVDASFALADTAAPLALDFQDGAVASVEANGTRLEPRYDGASLVVPASALSSGRNRVKVEFRHAWSTPGDGLYRFQDPADGRVYLYTDLEPFAANHVFPCFDQPDLRARWRLTVDAPIDWLVVSTARETETVDDGARRRWNFPETRPLSTYLFSMMAGPFQVWTSTAGTIPLRLLARRSMAPFVDADEWLRHTRQGLAYYQDYFAIPYPFGKYDQIILPDYSSGAMENAGAVGFSERFVPRGKATRHQREDRAETILHEMAHMWFGDLVTMRWWDDLWLNEAFATYLSNVATAEATEFKEAPVEMLLGEKDHAYVQDQTGATHPIEADVPDTAQAFANFDDITYGKGASALKQAAFLLGENAFRDGVRRYLSRHAWGNAERKDFIAALEEASGRDLREWTEEWLAAAGLNEARAEVACRAGRISSFAVLQSAPPGLPTLRRHRTAATLYHLDRGGLSPAGPPLAFEYAGPRTVVPSLAGSSCPEVVLLNAGDHDYAIDVLRPGEPEALERRLSRVSDDLDRALFWQALWQETRDGRRGASRFLSTALRHLPAETNVHTLARMAKVAADEGEDSALAFIAGPEPGAAYAEARRLAALAFFERLQAAPAGSDAQRLWYDAWLLGADEAGPLEAVLDGKARFDGFEPDPDRRWAAVIALCRLGAPACEARSAAETQRDPSRRAAVAAIKADAIRPDWKVKERWLARALAPGAGDSEDDLKAAIGALFPHEQVALRRRWAPRFFDALEKLGPGASNEFVEAFASSLAPLTCRAEDGTAVERALALRKVPAPAAKKLLRALDQNARCVRAKRD